MQKKRRLADGLYWHKRSASIWCRFWVRGREYRRSCKTRDPAAAEVEARRIRVEVEQAGVGLRAGRATLTSLGVDDILEHRHRGATAGHLASLETRWAKILGAMPQGITADAITRETIIAYEGARRAGRRGTDGVWIVQPCRGQTIRRETQAIRRALKIAKRRGLIAELPEFPVVRRDAADPRRSGKLWPAELLQQWLASLRDDARDEALFGALTGLRSQEIKRVAPTWVEPTPVSSSTPALLRIPAAATKTRTERIVGLSSAALAIVVRRLEAEPRRPLVFATANFRKHRETKARQLGFPTAPTLRDLRHCYASMALLGTSDPVGVMRALGHRDLSMTERYLSSTIDRVVAASAAVERMLLPEHPTGAPEAGSELSMARAAGVEPAAFGFGGRLSAAKWLQTLADQIEQERLRTAQNGPSPEHSTGAPIALAQRVRR